MPHVILGHCCKDASCVRACPLDCIHPAPGEPGFESAETLHIDPRSCIDCTACVEACPASAIKSEFDLTVAERREAPRNAAFFRDIPITPLRPADYDAPGRAVGRPGQRMRVAVVGSGPAALYTVRELLLRSGSVRVTVFEKYAEVGGLLRRGVSRDQTRVREMIRLFDLPFNDDRVEVVRGTEIGADIPLDDLRREFDAVVIACGASQPRAVGSPDAPIPGVYQAIDILVADNCGLPAPVRGENLGPRCLLVGAGNVAMDMVRHLAREHTGTVGEVVVVARSNRLACTPSAFQELADLDNVELCVDAAGVPAAVTTADGFPRDLLDLRRVDLSTRPQPNGTLRVVFSFGGEVVDISGTDRSAMWLAMSSGRVLSGNSVVCAAGFTMKEIEGLPIDERGIVPNRHGKVFLPETGAALEGVYVTGWAKRGATGGIGDNRACARETVEQLAIDIARTALDPLFER